MTTIPRQQSFSTPKMRSISWERADTASHHSLPWAALTFSLLIKKRKKERKKSWVKDQLQPFFSASPLSTQGLALPVGAPSSPGHLAIAPIRYTVWRKHIYVWAPSGGSALPHCWEHVLGVTSSSILRLMLSPRVLLDINIALPFVARHHVSFHISVQNFKSVLEQESKGVFT